MNTGVQTGMEQLSTLWLYLGPFIALCLGIVIGYWWRSDSD